MAGQSVLTIQNNKPLLVVIAGPTASGKTSLSIKIARHFHTNIISADSRQCYRELNIGVAKPSTDELKAVVHFFINSHSIHYPIDAACFEQYALEAITQTFKKNRIAIVVGGTGLYIKALCEGVDPIPKVPEAIRSEIMALYEAQGLQVLQKLIEKEDPEYYISGEIKNPQRLMRALEVVRFTGHSIRSYQLAKVHARPFNVLHIGLNPNRELLHHQINLRVDKMMDEGLLDEIKALLPFKHLNALQTVGYHELFDFLEGNCTLTEAIDTIKIHTRQYAKRQLTWFRKVQGMHWFGPGQEQAIINLIESKMQES